MRADLLGLQLSYNRWANRIIMRKAAEVEDADFVAHADGLSYGSLRGTLAHLVISEIVWRTRFEGRLPEDRFADATRSAELAASEFDSFETLFDLWKREDEEQRRFLESLRKSAAMTEISYQNSKGTLFRQPLGQLAAHLVNHSTQYRSEASVRLTELGLSPGELDMILYIRRHQG